MLSFLHNIHLLMILLHRKLKRLYKEFDLKITPFAIKTNEVTPIMEAIVETIFAFGKKKYVPKITILEKHNNANSNLFSDLMSSCNLIIFYHCIYSISSYFFKQYLD